MTQMGNEDMTKKKKKHEGKDDTNEHPTKDIGQLVASVFEKLEDWRGTQISADWLVDLEDQASVVRLKEFLRPYIGSTDKINIENFRPVFEIRYDVAGTRGGYQQTRATKANYIYTFFATQLIYFTDESGEIKPEQLLQDKREKIKSDDEILKESVYGNLISQEDLLSLLSVLSKSYWQKFFADLSNEQLIRLVSNNKAKTFDEFIQLETPSIDNNFNALRYTALIYCQLEAYFRFADKKVYPNMNYKSIYHLLDKHSPLISAKIWQEAIIEEKIKWSSNGTLEVNETFSISENVSINYLNSRERLLFWMVSLSLSQWPKFCADLQTNKLINLLSDSATISFEKLMQLDIQPTRDQLKNTALAFCLYEIYYREAEANANVKSFIGFTASCFKLIFDTEIPSIAAKFAQNAITQNKLYVNANGEIINNLPKTIKEMVSLKLNSRENFLSLMISHPLSNWPAFCAKLSDKKIVNALSNGHANTPFELFELEIKSSGDELRNTAIVFCLYEIYVRNFSNQNKNSDNKLPERIKGIGCCLSVLLTVESSYVAAKLAQQLLIEDKIKITKEGIVTKDLKQVSEYVAKSLRSQEIIFPLLKQLPLNRLRKFCEELQPETLISLLSDGKAQNFDELINLKFKSNSDNLINCIFAICLYESYLRDRATGKEIGSFSGSVVSYFVKVQTLTDKKSSVIAMQDAIIQSESILLAAHQLADEQNSFHVHEETLLERKSKLCKVTEHVFAIGGVDYREIVQNRKMMLELERKQKVEQRKEL